jgi:hypothetical protein
MKVIASEAKQSRWNLMIQQWIAAAAEAASQ